MKICLINNLYKPYARGGAEKITLTIAQGLLSAGHEVFIITTKPYLSKLPVSAEGQKEGIQIYYLNSLYHNLNKLPKFLRFFWHIGDMFNIISFLKIRKILKKEKCGAVITNNLMGLGYFTGSAVRRLNIKHLHLVHDIQLIHPSGLLFYGNEKLIESYFSRNYAGLSSQLFGSPGVVIFPSRWLMDLYLDKIFFIKSKRIILPNPVPPMLAESPDRANDTFKFLYLGQIEKHKGVNLLVQAYQKVRKKFPQIELVVAGDGSRLEQVKIEAGQDGSIKFLGWQTETQISKLFKICHCLVVPTLCYENCPAVILEAFSAGLPVVAADLGGISELLSKNAGVLFKPASQDDLIDKMVWVLENRNNLSAIVEAGRAKAALCSVENYIRELENLIK